MSCLTTLPTSRRVLDAPQRLLFASKKGEQGVVYAWPGSAMQESSKKEESRGDELASLAAEQFGFEIQQAPLLNSAFSSFNCSSADVIGYLALRVHLDRP